MNGVRGHKHVATTPEVSLKGKVVRRASQEASAAPTFLHNPERNIFVRSRRFFSELYQCTATEGWKDRRKWAGAFSSLDLR